MLFEKISENFVRSAMLNANINTKNNESLVDHLTQLFANDDLTGDIQIDIDSIDGIDSIDDIRCENAGNNNIDKGLYFDTTRCNLWKNN